MRYDGIPQSLARTPYQLDAVIPLHAPDCTQLAVRRNLISTRSPDEFLWGMVALGTVAFVVLAVRHS